MSHIKRVEAGQDDQTIHQNTTGGCLTPTMIKVGAAVLGLLLIGAGLTLYFLHVNAIAAYVTGGVGGAAIVGVAIWSLIDCLRGREFTLDRSLVEGNPRITEEEVAALLRDNPNVTKLRVKLRPHSDDRNWKPDFGALNAHFTFNFGASSGTWYIYYRK